MGTDDLGHSITPVTVMTASDGSYSFTGLRPGNYTVTESQPSAYVSGTNAVGTVNANTDGALATPTTDQITTISLASGNAGINYNFGERLTADLSVQKTDNVNGNAIPGDPITFTIKVTNNGPSVVNAFTLSDPLTSEPLQSPIFTPSAGSFASATGLWTGLTLASGQFITLTISGTVNPSASAAFTNVAGVSNPVNGPNPVVDPVSSNNSASDPITLTPQADVSVLKSTTATSVTAGNQISYTVVVSNTGPSDAQGVIWTDALPTNAAFVSQTEQVGDPVFVTTQPGGSIRDSIATLAAGATAHFTVTYTVNASTPPSTTQITNTANVTTTTPNTSPQTSSTVNTPLTFSADVSVAKSTTSTSVTAGNQISYTVVVSNTGPSDAQSVTWTDPLPTNATFVSQTEQVGDPAFTPSQAGGSISDSIATLAAGATAHFTVTYTINANTPPSTTQISNTANVTTTTPNPSTQTSSTVNTPLNFSADVSVAKSTTSTSVMAGNQISYTVVVSNTGPSDAQSVTWTDALPANATFVSQTEQVGDPVFTPSQPGGNISDSIATLAAGATAHFTVTYTVNANTPPSTTQISNTASVTTTTPNPSTQTSSTVNTPVTFSADLSIAKTGPANANAGDTFSYSLTVHNAGPSDAQSVVVADALPSGVALLSQAVPQDDADQQTFHRKLGVEQELGKRLRCVPAQIEPALAHHGGERKEEGQGRWRRTGGEIAQERRIKAQQHAKGNGPEAGQTPQTPELLFIPQALVERLKEKESCSCSVSAAA